MMIPPIAVSPQPAEGRQETGDGFEDAMAAALALATAGQAQTQTPVQAAVVDASMPTSASAPAVQPSLIPAGGVAVAVEPSTDAATAPEPPVGPERVAGRPPVVPTDAHPTLARMLRPNIGESPAVQVTPGTPAPSEETPELSVDPASAREQTSLPAEAQAATVVPGTPHGRALDPASVTAPAIASVSPTSQPAPTTGELTTDPAEAVGPAAQPSAVTAPGSGPVDTQVVTMKPDPGQTAPAPMGTESTSGGDAPTPPPSPEQAPSPTPDSGGRPSMPEQERPIADRHRVASGVEAMSATPDGIAPIGQPAATHDTGTSRVPAAMLQRVEEAVRALEQGPPPRSMTLTIDDEGVTRITVSLVSDGVRLSVPEGSQASPRLLGDLEQALANRGFDLSKERGHGSREQRDETDGFRPHSSNTPNRRPADHGVRL